MIRRNMAVVGLSALAVLLGACATTSPRSAPLDDEVRELRELVSALQRRNTVTELELQRLRVKVAELELQERRAARAQVPTPVERPPVDVGPEESIEPERPGTIQSSDLEPEVVVESAEIEPSTSLQPPVVDPDPPPAPAATTAVRLTDAAQALYDQGYTEYNQGQYVSAETTFQRFLQQHGDTSLADNAQFWIGEARYSRGDVRGALAAFRETVARFPDGNKAPDALLRSGRCLEELGDTEGALESYRTLVARFPDSADALIAEDRIRALGG